MNFWVERNLQFTKFVVALWYNLIIFISKSRYMYLCYQNKFQTIQRIIHLNLEVLPLFKLLFLSKGLGGMEDDV